MQYTLKMCIVCHSASVILEMFVRTKQLQNQLKEKNYQKYQSKSYIRDWICSAFKFKALIAGSQKKLSSGRQRHARARAD
jgi:hypothetical protein